MERICCSKICMCLPCWKLFATPCAGEPATGGLGMWAVCSFISKGMSCLASEKLAFYWVTLNMTLIFFFFPACVGDVSVRIRHTLHDARRFKSAVKRDWAHLRFNEQFVEVIWLSMIQQTDKWLRIIFQLACCYSLKCLMNISSWPDW